MSASSMEFDKSGKEFQRGAYNIFFLPRVYSIRVESETFGEKIK